LAHRTLIRCRGLRRRITALVAIFSVSLYSGPVLALSGAVATMPELDPSVAALMRDRGVCGYKPTKVAALPAAATTPVRSFSSASGGAFVVRTHAPNLAARVLGPATPGLALPSPTAVDEPLAAATPNAAVGTLIVRALANEPSRVAQTVPGAQLPTTAPQPGADTGETPVPTPPNLPTPTPNPSASPTFIPIPPVPPIGPQTLLVPTPLPTGTASPTPYPLPTPTPTATAGGPIFLTRPAGTPTPLPPKVPYQYVTPSPGPGGVTDAGAAAAATPAAAPAASASPLGAPGSGATPIPVTAAPAAGTLLGPDAARPSASPAGLAASPAPSASLPPGAAAAGVAPSPTRTLGPNEIVTIADRLTGSSDKSQPSDLIGNVHVFFSDGQIVGDRAHFDGEHTISVSGHTYIVNRVSDAILYAERIDFDTQTKRATLIGGSGETVEGVQQGKLYFSAQRLTTNEYGVAHGERASFTTCAHPHAGYHIEARSIDVMPGDRLIARKAVIFLGPTAVFYIPTLVIPLREYADERRQATFLPVIGYDQVDGFFIKARIGFAPSPTYYGYYRVEYFTKRGLGLGYVAFAGSKTGRRYVTVDAYTINDRIQGGRQTNFSLQEVENFNRRLRSLVGVQYQGDYGPNINLPASLNVTGSVIRQGNASTENLTFTRFLQGNLSDNLNVGLVDSINVTKTLNQQINLAYTKFNSPIVSSNTLHINTNTHLFSKFADYNLTYDKTDYSSNPFGFNKEPELQILPHINYGNFRFGPQLQLTAGEYSEPQNHFATQRVQGVLNETAYAKVFHSSDFTANYTIAQDYYGTGDLKGFESQNATLTTPIGNHVVNALTYNEQHPFGPSDVPFQLLDRLSSGQHSAQEVIRVFNRDIYSFSLSDGTNFARQAQPVSYQFGIRPSLRSYVVLGGFYTPGPGQGFGLTNIQAITPFGLATTLELTTNVDWHNHGRLENKNIYLTRTIADCYNVQFAYNQDLKSFTFNVSILAFPGQSAGFGFGGTQQPSGILPQNFAF